MKADYLVPVTVTGCAVIAVCIVIGLLLRKQTHDYLVVYHTQTNGTYQWQTRNIIVRGTKFTPTDDHWFRTNQMAGNTNMAIVILNIIKLDD